MPLLFSYGSIQDETVQMETIGRRLAGSKDAIVGFELTTSGPYKNIKPNDSSQVSGTVYEIRDAELAIFDEYEAGAAYARIEVRLGSGRSAWVYLAPTSE